jgi:hypothetical protein
MVGSAPSIRPSSLGGEEGAVVQAAHQRRVHRRLLEAEALQVLHHRQAGDAEPIADPAAPSFRRLGPQQIAQDLLDPATEPEPLDHGVVEGGHHAPELELTHEGEQLMALHERSRWCGMAAGGRSGRSPRPARW